MRIATTYRPATTYTANGRRKPHRVQAMMVCYHGDSKQYHSKSLIHNCDNHDIVHHHAAAVALLDRLGIKGTVTRGRDYATSLGWDVCTS